MNITQLQYFFEVCNLGTVSDAAKHLHISQPSVSNAIIELEKEFGVKLFRRLHRGMVLTEEGEKLFHSSRELLAHHKSIESMMHEMGKKERLLRLGVPPLTAQLMLSQVYRDFVPKNPDIRLKISEHGYFELMSQLSKDFLDLVILPHTKAFDKDLSSVKIGTLEVVCCVNKDNPLSSLKKISAKHLENQPVILFGDDFLQTKEILSFFKSREVTPDILLQTEQLSTAWNIIENNLAAGFMFRALAESRPNLVPISLDKPIYIDISLVYRKNRLWETSKSFIEYVENNNLLEFYSS